MTPNFSVSFERNLKIYNRLNSKCNYELKLTICVYFSLNKYRKLVKFNICCGTKERFVQITKKKSSTFLAA